MVIVFNVGYTSKPWSAFDIEKYGLGGTEKCVALLSSALAELGHEVYVVGQIHENNIQDNPRYVRYENLNSTKPIYVYENLQAQVPKTIDLLVGVNYINYLVYFKDFEVKKNFFWIHNTDYYQWFEGEKLNEDLYHLNHRSIDRIVCLTEWHKETISQRYGVDKERIITIPNPIDNSKFLPFIFDDKIPNSFIYTSHAERGLSNLIDEWPKILERCPDATLHIATPEYGMDYFNDHFLHKVMPLQGVTFYGSLGQDRLYALMAKCQVWYYPSDYEETYCLTAIEMMVHGIVPSTRLTASLAEVVGDNNVSNWYTALETANKWKDEVEPWGDVPFYPPNHVAINWIEQQEELKKENTMNLKPDIAYVIMLNPSEEKIAQAHEKFSKLGIDTPLEIFNAVDGTNPVVDFRYEVFKGWKMRSDNKWWSREITQGEVGCALSHLSVWKDAARRGFDNVLILEEDFDVLREWPDNEFYWPEDWDWQYTMLYLGRSRMTEDKRGLTEFLVEPDYSYNMHAYLLTGAGIQRLLEQNFQDFICPLDEFVPATYAKHPRGDMDFITRDTFCASVIEDVIGQTSNSSTSTTSNTDPVTNYKMPSSSLISKDERLHPELYETQDWEQWKRRWIHESARTKEWDLICDEPVDNVFTFPLFTKEFCEKIIREAEHCGKWERKRHEYYPTTDMLIEKIGFQDIFHKVLCEYVYPMSKHKWALEGKTWDDLSSENFMIKYDSDVQGHLSLHHDHGSISCVLALNDDFKGGGTYFWRQKKLHNGDIGHISVHPSVITHRHGGRPVEEGQRFIIVSFCNRR